MLLLLSYDTRCRWTAIHAAVWYCIIPGFNGTISSVNSSSIVLAPGTLYQVSHHVILYIVSKNHCRVARWHTTSPCKSSHINDVSRDMYGEYHGHITETSILIPYYIRKCIMIKHIPHLYPNTSRIPWHAHRSGYCITWYIKNQDISSFGGGNISISYPPGFQPNTQLDRYTATPFRIYLEQHKQIHVRRRLCSSINKTLIQAAAPAEPVEPLARAASSMVPADATSLLSLLCPLSSRKAFCGLPYFSRMCFSDARKIKSTSETSGRVYP